jgi:hypothetical protein
MEPVPPPRAFAAEPQAGVVHLVLFENNEALLCKKRSCFCVKLRQFSYWLERLWSLEFHAFHKENPPFKNNKGLSAGRSSAT